MTYMDGDPATAAAFLLALDGIREATKTFRAGTHAWH
jgi:hypothetical protein